jgi:hypothetical protein
VIHWLRSRHARRSRWRGLAASTMVALSLATVLSPATSAHGPDPTLGRVFADNQDLRFRWRAGSEPTAAIKTAIRAAATDADDSRGSKAATFTYDAGGPNPIGYGAGATCGVNGLACFTRDAPNGFTMWLREQGHVFDWGTLKWCQAYTSPPTGCYDAETIALDEFGHVEGLGHHVNFADNSDYGDAVVQTYSRTKPQTGWDYHTLRRCDVATLQLQYDMVSTTAKYSTCLDLATVLSLSPSTTTIASGGILTLTATLKVAVDGDYDDISGNLVSGRTVTLQRRVAGTSTWTSLGPIPAGTALGTYATTQTPTVDMEYRAVFSTPSNEGLHGATSPVVRVSIAACAGALARDVVAVPCV